MKSAAVFAFDFDGVIVDSGSAYVRAINSAAAALGATRLMDLEQLANMPEYSHRCSARLVGLAEHRVEEFSEGLQRCFHRSQNVRLNVAMGPLLRRLSEHGEIVLVSANDEKAMVAALARLELRVDTIYAGRAAAAKAEVLRQLARRARVVMIGDTLSDCRAATIAEVDAVAVSWGWQGAALLSQAGVPVMHSPEQLQTFLLRWFRV